MKKLFVFVISALMSLSVFAISASAATTHTVVSGDSMWKIAVKYQVGLVKLLLGGYLGKAVMKQVGVEKHA